MSLRRVTAWDICDALSLVPLSLVCSILPGLLFIVAWLTVLCIVSLVKCPLGARLECSSGRSYAVSVRFRWFMSSVVYLVITQTTVFYYNFIPSV